MAVTHTWSVDSALKTRTQGDLDNVVFSVVWRLDSSEVVDGKTWSTQSANQITLNTENLDPATFTAFADLTESQVLGWAKDTINANAAEGEGVTCDEWEAGHERNIAKQQNPPTQNQRAPWAAE